MTARRDWLVILARGESRRMGRPKGLLPVPGRGGESFVATIAASYRDLGFAGCVVTLPALVRRYDDALAGWPGLTVVGADGGGDTARTVWHGWQAAPAPVTHLWAHPVDVPLVRPETLSALAEASGRQPLRPIRPSWRGSPGHPVIVPTAGLAVGLAALWWQDLAMKEFLGRAAAAGLCAPITELPLMDPGAGRDFDTPDDLIS